MCKCCSNFILVLKKYLLFVHKAFWKYEVSFLFSGWDFWIKLKVDFTDTCLGHPSFQGREELYHGEFDFCHLKLAS